ncbi:MAG: low molecular weight phosphatase family protein [Alphaproteobacteria bacterium]|nr:low molecular weight phosphatase family protein [Alphaproteobacteria bacterium]
MNDFPKSVLFACNRNTIRSPMAEALMKHLLGHRIYVDSVGVRLAANEVDPFAIAALAEIGLDISRHRPKSFDDIADQSIDLIVTFTPQAQHRAVELTRTIACDIEYWPMADPTIVEGNRDTRLAAYRDLREDIFEHIKRRFPLSDAPLD